MMSWAAPAGGEEAVARAAREHAQLVYGVARAVLKNHHDAEDAAQEVFLRVLRLRRGLEGVESPRTWLARVAFRVALDRRANPARREVSLQDEEAAGALASLRSPELAADESAWAGQRRSLLARKVADLPADLRQAVRLSTVGGLTSPEIAEVLGIPEGTVRTRLMRARRLLRIALAAALGLVLAAGTGILLLRTRRTEEKSAAVAPTRPGVSSKGEERGEPGEPGISSKGGAPASQAVPIVARGSAVSHPSKRIFFPSPAPLSTQEQLLVAYVEKAAAPDAAALSGFLDEPAPLPPLPDDASHLGQKETP